MAPTSRYWSAYWRDRQRLDRADALLLDEQLTAWMIGLVRAEMQGELAEYPGAVGKIGWMELPDFRVLIRVRLERGNVEHIDFFGVRQK